MANGVRNDRSALAGTWRWVGLAIALLLAGSSLAGYAAQRVAHGDAQRSETSFRATAADVAATLQLAIRHEEDLVLGAQAFAVSQPVLSQHAFTNWLAAVQVRERYPELNSLGVVAVVPAARLAEVQRALIADPVRPSTGSDVTIVPGGARPFYCLGVAGFYAAGQPAIPAGFDFCAGAVAPAVDRIRDAGLSLYTPGPAKQPVLLVFTPVYATGVTPPTVAARRQSFWGFVGLTMSPAALFQSALHGHPGAVASLTYRQNGDAAAFVSGPVPRGARSVTTDLHNGWTQTTYAPADPSSVWGDANAARVLVGGVVVSVLLAGLFSLLGTGRRRALLLVERKTSEIKYMALHDALTGLPNRALILDRVEQALARARRAGSAVGLMFLDLDGFKDINDTYGHAAGDELLRQVAARLSGELRDQDTAARLGGDEFVVLIDGASTVDSARQVAERIQAVFAEPFDLHGVEERALYVHTSIGIALGVRATAGDLLRDADVALYQAKASGKHRSVMFTPAMQVATQERLELEMDLRASVAALSAGVEEFDLVYQPVFDLANGAVTGVEALVRWQHPSRGLVLPDDFVAVAEQSGVILPLGRWVLERACELAARWARDGQALAMSVNISPRQLEAGKAFVDTVAAALRGSGLAPQLLVLEVSEGMLMRDPAASARRLGALKELGVRVAIDDFGTGNSSLAYLHEFPVDVLKLDPSFVHGATTTPELAGAVIQLGRARGITTVAEGIERSDQLAELRGQGCGAGQGFLLAAPMSVGDLEQSLAWLPERVRSVLAEPSSGPAVPLPRQTVPAASVTPEQC